MDTRSQPPSGKDIWWPFHFNQPQQKEVCSPFPRPRDPSWAPPQTKFLDFEMSFSGKDQSSSNAWISMWHLNVYDYNDVISRVKYYKSVALSSWSRQKEMKSRKKKSRRYWSRMVCHPPPPHLQAPTDSTNRGSKLIEKNCINAECGQTLSFHYYINNTGLQLFTLHLHGFSYSHDHMTSGDDLEYTRRCVQIPRKHYAIVCKGF